MPNEVHIPNLTDLEKQLLLYFNGAGEDKYPSASGEDIGDAEARLYELKLTSIWRGEGTAITSTPMWRITDYGKDVAEALTNGA